MNSMKRNLSSTSFFDDQTKRFRRNTCLEDLPNELFYEIFDYIDGCDIYNAFSNLNIRFEFFLTRSLTPLKINVSSKSKSTPEQRCRNVIIPNKHRILSLNLNSQSIIRSFFDHCTIDSSFNRLESVVLNELSPSKLTAILFYLNSLPRLFALTVHLEEDYYYNLNDIYRLIFHLPHLKYNKLSLSEQEESEILIPQSINEKPSTIQHLIIDFSCTLDELTSILVHTPHLRHLTCEKICETEDTIKGDLLKQLKLPELIDISIGECELEFDKFEMFIKKISSKLQKFRIEISNYPGYLDGNRWKQLIKRHMPYLREFHFDHSIDAYSFQDMMPNVEAIRQFTSTFWTERYWCFEFKDSSDEITYSIHPYKKMWFDRDADRSDRVSNQCTITSNSIHNGQQSDKTCTSPIQLTIAGYTAATWDLTIINDMKPCFDAIPFTHLNIDCSCIPIDSLIEIIHLLPNLEVLNLLSLPRDQLDDMSFEDAEMLLLVSINNKITKVKIGKMDGIEQLQFLTSLCSRMRYLEVECATDNNLEDIIGCISMNNGIHIPYLYSLCVSIPNANEMMIQKLDDIINFERLFRNDNRNFCDYVMQRVQNKIFLDWKI